MLGIQAAGRCHTLAVGVVMIHSKFSHTVSVKYLDPEDVIRLATWCVHNFKFNTWCWGGGQFQFVNESDAVQFALLLD